MSLTRLAAEDADMQKPAAKREADPHCNIGFRHFHGRVKFGNISQKNTNPVAVSTAGEGVVFQGMRGYAVPVMRLQYMSHNSTDMTYLAQENNRRVPI